MRHAIIANGVVVNMAEAEAEFGAAQGWIASETASIGDLWDGSTFSKPPVDPLQVQAETTAEIQRLLDSTAQSHGYDDLRSTISYIGSSIPHWNAEGVRAKAWRDECWWLAYQIQEAVKAGTRALPTPAQVVAEMPPANWPQE